MLAWHCLRDSRWLMISERSSDKKSRMYNMLTLVTWFFKFFTSFPFLLVVSRSTKCINGTIFAGSGAFNNFPFIMNHLEEPLEQSWVGNQKSCCNCSSWLVSFAFYTPAGMQVSFATTHFYVLIVAPWHRMVWVLGMFHKKHLICCFWFIHNRAV